MIFFFVPHKQLHSVSEASIGLITWSDHAPIFLKYNLTDRHHTSTRLWKLNESLLQDPIVREDVQREIEWFFQMNDNSDSPPGVIWETHKAVIRGVLIKHGARIKKEREAK